MAYFDRGSPAAEPAFEVHETGDVAAHQHVGAGIFEAIELGVHDGGGHRGHLHREKAAKTATFAVAIEVGPFGSFEEAIGGVAEPEPPEPVTGVLVGDQTSVAFGGNRCVDVVGEEAGQLPGAGAQGLRSRLRIRPGEETRVVVGQHLGARAGRHHDRVFGSGEDLDRTGSHLACFIHHAHVHRRLATTGLAGRAVHRASRRFESGHRSPPDLRRHGIDEARGHELDAHPVRHVIPYRPAVVFIPTRGPKMRRRLAQLVLGLVAFGVGIGLMLQSGLGVPPWDVLHQGMAVRFGLTVGVWSVIVSVLVLLLWIPLKERFGLGTLLNAVVIGLTIDGTAAIVPEAGNTMVAWAMLLAGVLIIAVATGMYIGANMGPGPRDGLMTGIAKRGPSIRLTRALIEISVLALGWLLGGTFGVGTVVFAFGIGPLVQIFMPRWDMSLEVVPPRP